MGRVYFASNLSLAALPSFRNFSCHFTGFATIFASLYIHGSSAEINQKNSSDHYKKFQVPWTSAGEPDIFIASAKYFVLIIFGQEFYSGYLCPTSVLTLPQTIQKSPHIHTIQAEIVLLDLCSYLSDIVMIQLIYIVGPLSMSSAFWTAVV
jgi:hypothetical protein